MGPDFDIFPIMAAIWFGGIAAIVVIAAIYKNFIAHTCTPICGKEVSRLSVLAEIVRENGITADELSTLKHCCYGELHLYSIDQMLHPAEVIDHSTIQISYCPGCKKILDPRIDLAKTLQDNLAKIRDANRRITYYEDTKKLLTDITNETKSSETKCNSI